MTQIPNINCPATRPSITHTHKSVPTHSHKLTAKSKVTPTSLPPRATAWNCVQAEDYEMGGSVLREACMIQGHCQSDMAPSPLLSPSYSSPSNRCQVLSDSAILFFFIAFATHSRHLGSFRHKVLDFKYSCNKTEGKKEEGGSIKYTEPADNVAHVNTWRSYKRALKLTIDLLTDKTDVHEAPGALFRVGQKWAWLWTTGGSGMGGTWRRKWQRTH